MAKRLIVDDYTGEVLMEMGRGDRISTAASREAFRAHQASVNEATEETETIKQFFKGNGKEIALLLPELDMFERSFLFSVAPYVNYSDCCLKYSNGRDITTNDLIRLTGLSRSKLFDTANSLLSKDIIYKGINSKNRQYYVNPWLFCKGNNLNRVLRSMFKNYRIRSLGGKKWGNLND